LRAVAVRRDALVVTSSLWMTTATALRSGDEAFLVDSPYFPDELEALPTLLGQSGFELNGLLGTHADFDHLLGRLAFPDLPLGVGESTALRLKAEPGVAQRELRNADADHYVKRERPLSLGTVQSLPVPGKLDFGETELELHPAEGHTADGTAFHWREAALLVCGDYLSDVEIPTVASIDDYRATLARLGRLADEADTVIPGHGSILDRDAALRILDEDVEYLDALERGDERPGLPTGRDTARQRQLHQQNLTRLRDG
jgi:glyoxylase-like metal-dependent hydrolase (beta-lactamase superfamily II)